MNLVLCSPYNGLSKVFKDMLEKTVLFISPPKKHQSNLLFRKKYQLLGATHVANRSKKRYSVTKCSDENLEILNLPKFHYITLIKSI